MFDVVPEEDMSKITGSPPRHAGHNMPAASMGFMLSMAIPAAVVVIGLLTLGFGAIHWPASVVCGAAATLAFALFGAMGRKMGMTRLDVTDLLGSLVARPHSNPAKTIGLLMHMMNGALLAIAWAYGVALVGGPANWLTGLVWGILLWPLALLMLSTMGAVHPAIRRGEQDDPGVAATNFGKMTPVGSLLGHMVYGVVLGAAYSVWVQ